MPVMYDEKYIIPAPFVNIDVAKRRTDDGRQIGAGFSVKLSGTFLSYISGIFDSEAQDVKNPYVADEALSKLLEKQQELVELFATEGKELLIQGLDTNYSTMKLYPRIDSISFGEGNWNKRCEYNIELYSDNAYNNDGEIINPSSFGSFGDYRLESVGDEYTLRNNENGTAEVLRTIRAQGSLVYDSGNNGQILGGILPWQYASGWCNSVYNNDIEPWYSGIVNEVLPGYVVIDTKKEVDVDQLAGNFEIIRGWIVSNVGVYVTTKSLRQQEDMV